MTTNLVADANLKEQASLKEIVLLQDNFSACLESPENQDVKASIAAAALQSDAENRGNTSKCGKNLSVERALHAWRSSIVFLQATSMLYALHSGEAERGHVGVSRPCLKDDLGQRALHLGEAFCRRQGQQSLFPLAEWRKPETALCGRVACRAVRSVRTCW